LRGPGCGRCYGPPRITRKQPTRITPRTTNRKVTGLDPRAIGNPWGLRPSFHPYVGGRTLKWLKVKVAKYRVEERGFYKP
jgi:hypothetical protein